MAFTVDIEVKKRFKVKAPVATVFELLADVPESASHFPKVDELVDLGDNCYRWEMEKIGLDKYNLQTVYACQYRSNKRAGTVTWEPLEDEGNALVDGQWTIKKASPSGTNITLVSTAAIDLPFPKLVKFVVAPLVEREFQGLIDEYIANLKDTLNG
jgi:carbon monoxide dehydrogenase subunit G